MTDKPITIEKTLDAPSEKVWQALTDREQMKLWYFDLAEFRPEVGFGFQFWGGEETGTKYLHLCRVTEAVAGQKLAYSWRYDGYEGSSEVCFELFAEDGKTRLRLTHAGLETFPESNPDFAKKNFEAGWTTLVGELLPGFLEKNG